MNQNKKMILLLFSALIFFVGCTSVGNQPDDQPIDTKPPVEAMAKEFRERLFQETDDNGIVKEYESKDELMTYFLEICDIEVAKYYIDNCYMDTDEGLLLIPKGGPILFDPELEYDLNKIDENNYEVIQHAENMLHGKYVVKTGFEKIEDAWIITQIEVEILE